MQTALPYDYTPRTYQLPLWRHMQAPGTGKRAACVWHRRAGKDLCAINLTAPSAFERVGVYWHVLPTYKQGRNIVWNGFTKEGKPFLSHFPDDIIASKNSTEMRITFKNKSIYQVVGTDNINSLVGTNPVGVVFSEYSLHDPAAWDYLRPIMAENEGWAIFIFTMRGKNHGYKLYEMAKKNPKWFAQKLVAGSDGTRRDDGSPVISDEAIDEERKAGMPEELIQQEFYCSAEAPLVGAYYSSQMMWLDKQGKADAKQSRFTKVPWDPRLPVDTWWDLGYDDSTTIWFVQHHGLETRLIEYYENSGESLQHYAKVLKERDYMYGQHLAPFDIMVHEFTSGKTRFEAAREMGIRFKVVPKHTVEDGIESVRAFLPRCWFDEEKCSRGIAALREYCKAWNETQKVFSNQPLHNWASHGADAFRIGVRGTRPQGRTRKTLQGSALDTHDYLRGNGGDDEEQGGGYSRTPGGLYIR